MNLFYKNNVYIFCSIIFLLSGILVFPLFFIYPYSGLKTVQYLFSMPSISSLAFALIFLNFVKFKELLKSGKNVFFLSILFIVIPCIHYFLIDTTTFREWSFSILWISIPLFSCIYYNELKKLLPWYLLFIWGFDIFISFTQRGEIVGIAGNRNWHALFLILLIIFNSFTLISLWRNNRKLLLKIVLATVYGILVVTSLLIVYKCESRGAWLSLGATAALFFFIRFYHGLINVKFKKTLYLTLSALFSLFIIFILIFLLLSASKNSTLSSQSLIKNTELKIEKIDESLFNDVRGPLWAGSLNMIMDYPLLGAGTQKFETFFAPYRPISYFTKPDNAVRSNHPHSSLLYIAACYGIPAFLIWAVLWIYPIFYFIKRYPKQSIFDITVFLCYVCLFLHSLIDLILFEWPTIFIGCVLVGLLWNKTFTRDSTEETIEVGNKKSILIPLLSTITGVVLLILTCRTVYNDYKSSEMFRLGRIYDLKHKTYNALYYYNKGLEYFVSPKYLYKASIISLLDFNDPKLSLRYLNMFKEISLSDYAHMNSFIALALIKLGEKKIALPYLIKAAVNYPLLTGNWFRLSMLQKELNMNRESEISYQNMIKTIEFKHLPKSALILLLKNPKYDSHPHRIPEKILQQLKSK